MKYVSLDLETTCLDHAPSNILMFSFVIEDTEHPKIPVEDLPHFTGFVDPGVITGSARALSMNSWILDILSGVDKAPKYSIFHGTDWVPILQRFLADEFLGKSVTVAGKNVAGFDMRFLPPEAQRWFKRRVMDVGMACFDIRRDKEVPDLAECKKRCGIFTPVAHDAREDAMDVIRCFRAIACASEHGVSYQTDVFR